MGEFIDLGILLFFGVCFNFFDGSPDGSVIAFLLTISLCFYQLLYKKIVLIPVAFFILAAFFQSFFPFLPCIFYVMIPHRLWKDRYLLVIVAYLLLLLQQPSRFIQGFIMLIAWLLRTRYLENEELKKAYLLQRDNTKELALLLEEKNKDLIVRQEQEIKIATLNERNRIAREIHDHVGHLLSSSLLQVGALQALNQNEQLRDLLQDLRGTISKGMDNVRNSVHDLHEDAMDLHIVLQKLCHDFTFCEAQVEYDIVHPLSSKQYYHVIAIIKESLTNTMKHSNATNIHIILREQPAFYQLRIQDNGTRQIDKPVGIGLRNIIDRVDSLHGYCNIDKNNGFLIYITLPKESEAHESINY